MGRKKRKTEAGPVVLNDDAAPPPDPLSATTTGPAAAQAIDTATAAATLPASATEAKDSASKKEDETEDNKQATSSYGLHAHSGALVSEDVYVSDGSEDSEIDILMTASQQGLMRRGGLVSQSLVQPTRQWVRPEGNASGDNKEGEAKVDPDQAAQDQLQAELAQLDPAQRAARLLVEKQRLEQLQAEAARLKESAENAGRDPSLFSRRTAFDIRFDQIEDKPWTRPNAGDMSDFFNYGLHEEDWLEYAQQQLAIRQELQDAAKQGRAPDPTIVPVQPLTATSGTAVAAVAETGEGDAAGTKEAAAATATTADGTQVAVGPVVVAGPAENQEQMEDSTAAVTVEKPQEGEDVNVGVGGAWGAGAAPGSVLARLIAEQEQPSKGGSGEPAAADISSSSGHDAGGFRQQQQGYYGRPSGAPQQQQQQYGGGDYGSSGGGRGWQQEQQHSYSSYDNRGQGGRGFHGRGGRFGGNDSGYRGGRGGGGRGDYHNRPARGSDPRWRR